MVDVSLCVKNVYACICSSYVISLLCNRMCFNAVLAARYLASHVLSAIVTCFLELHDVGLPFVICI